MTPSGRRTSRRRPPRPGRISLGLTGGLLLVLALVVGCGAPGGSVAHQTSTPAHTGVGSSPVTMTVVADATLAGMWTALANAFHAKYPNVTLSYRGEQFQTLQQNVPRLISGSDAPDLVQTPTLGNLVKDHLLTNLDGYAAAYGWDKFPQAQFAEWRITSDGLHRGSDGHLFAVGLGYTLTGVYYNRSVAAKIGMTQPPATLSDFVALLRAAKAQGYVGLMANGKDGGLMFPLQAVQMDFGGNEPVNDWVFGKPGADINTPATVQAATTISDWAKQGLLPSDVVSLDETAALTRFTQGKAPFYYNGNWDAATLDKEMAGNVGFFLFPPRNAGDPHRAMSDPASFGIPVQAKHPDVAAAFMNWVQTDPKARQIIFDTTGSAPGGSPSVGPPTAAAMSASSDALAGFDILSQDNGVAAYMADATASILSETETPQTQLLVTGRTTPAAFAAKLQSDYVAQLGQ